MSERGKDTPQEGGKAKPASSSPQKSPIKTASASPGFQRALRSPEMNTLCDARCNRETFKWILVTLIESEFRDDPGRLRGKGRNLKTILKRLRKAADDIEYLDSLIVIHSALHRTHYDSGRFWALPTSLRELAEAIEHAEPQASGKTHPHRDQIKALLVAYVEKETGRQHDEEVSALISAALDNADYSTQTHKNWRSDHTADIDRQRPLVPAAIREALDS